jgi:hypothetical protein
MMKSSLQNHKEFIKQSHQKLSNFRRLSIFAVSLALLILGLCGIFNPTKQAITSAFNSVLSQPQTVTRYETKNIEDIQKDDYVLAYDVRTGEITKRKVTDVFKRQADHIRYLTVLGTNNVTQTFGTTDSHAYWVVTDKPDLSRVARDVVEENGVILQHENLVVTDHGFYVEAKNLRVGDIFIGPSGELTTFVDSQRVDYPDGITVYNFTVEDDHNYFVIANYEAYQNGAEPVLVHNANYSQQNATNLRNSGLDDINLHGKSYNSGRKLLEAKGFTLSTTKTTRKVFTKTINGKTVKISFDSGRALVGNQKPHWHIQLNGVDLNAFGKTGRNPHIPANY